MESRNARTGIVLFAVYLVLYGGFVFLNAFFPEKMEMTPVSGLNLAILYGFGLIIAALVLALLYGFLCRHEEVVADSAAAGSESSNSPEQAAQSTGDKK